MVNWEDSQYQKNQYFASYGASQAASLRIDRLTSLRSPVSSVKVACYNPGLLSTLSIDQDAPYDDVHPVSSTSDPFSGIANAFLSQPSIASSTSRSMWWSPPSATAEGAGALPTLFAGWGGRARLGRREAIGKSVRAKRADGASNPASYQYTGASCASCIEFEHS